MDPTLDSQITAASRSLEEARHAAHRDPTLVGKLVNQISVLADLRQKSGDFRKAESLYREALFTVQEMRKPDPEMLCGLHSLLAHLYDRWGRMDQSAVYYQKALKIAETGGISTSDKVATIKNNLAMIFKQTSDFKKAEQYYQEALDIFRQTDGNNSARVASVCNNLGVLYYAKQDVVSSQKMHEHALNIRENLAADQSDPGDLSQSYINLGAVYRISGNEEQAEECVARAKTIRANMNSRLPQRRMPALV